MTVKAGTRFGPYEILAPLGAGGMGEVWKAKDSHLEREVAIKVLPVAFAEEKDRVRRFQQEAKVLAALNHPNLVQIHEAGEHEGTPYLVMELLEGVTLRERLQGKPLPPKRAAEIARETAQGLSAAHGKGILHRDLKPENIWIARDGRVKVLDFGLAKFDVSSRIGQESATRAFLSEPGTVVGTSGYMSPEQVRGEALDARTDIFSLGIILWEMLTGQRPFEGGSSVEVMHAILKEDPADLDEALKVPLTLERIVHTCLAKDPAGRFHSAHDLAFALDHLGSSSRTSGAGTTAIASSRAARLLTWVAAIVILAVGAIVGWLGHRPPVAKIEKINSYPMAITSAKFMPDGKNIVFSAINGDSEELYIQSPGDRVPHPLGIKNAKVLAVSPRGELALSMPSEKGPSLALLEAVGLAPRTKEVGNITAACWAPDGRSIITKHQYFMGKNIHAFLYQGRVLYKVPFGHGVGDFTLSPDNKGICFTEGIPGKTYFVQVSLDGKVISKFVTDLVVGLHASAGGRLFGWNSAKEALVEFNVKGQVVRTLMPLADGANIWDALPGGTILMNQPRSAGSEAMTLIWNPPGSAFAQQVQIQVGSSFLANNGKSIAYTTFANSKFHSWIATDGSAARTYLGEGMLSGLSSDGERAFLCVPSPNENYYLKIIPIGAGKETLVNGSWFSIKAWSLPGHSKALASGIPTNSQDYLEKSFMLDESSGECSQLSFLARGPVSPDGTMAFSPPPLQASGRWESGLWGIVELATGRRSELPSICKGMMPCQWSTSGQAIWVTSVFPSANEMVKLDLKTGKFGEKKILPAGRPRVMVGLAQVTPDGNSFAYIEMNLSPTPSTLYRLTGGE